MTEGVRMEHEEVAQVPVSLTPAMLFYDSNNHL